MMKYALMLLVNPLVVFSGQYVYSYFKLSKIIESNKDEIKRCPVTFLMHFM